MKKHGPSCCPDEPRDGYASTVRTQLVAALAATHSVGRTATVELWAAFSQPQQRGISSDEGDNARLLIHFDLLDTLAVRRLDREGEGLRRNTNRKIAGFENLRAQFAAQLSDGRFPGGAQERTVGGYVRYFSSFVRK